MLRRKLYGSRSLENMKLSTVGMSILVLVIASVAQCIGATGKFIFYVEELIFIFSSSDSLQNGRKKALLEVIVKHVNFVVNSFVFRAKCSKKRGIPSEILHTENH